jgi:hypothetical protein
VHSIVIFFDSFDVISPTWGYAHPVEPVMIFPRSMILYINRKEWEALQKDETRTVMLMADGDPRLWRDYADHCGGAVRVLIREISDDEMRVREALQQGEKPLEKHG